MQETKVSYSEITLPGKPCFLFQDVLKRWSFQKNCTGIWSFLYYWERWYFFFPNIWSYTLDGKWKMIFLKKIHENIIFSSNFLKIWSFQKGPPRHIIFFVLSGKMVFFFPENMIFFPWAESERRSFSENTWKYEIFCVHVWVLQTWHHAPLPKKSKMVLSRRNTPKGDWRSRLTSWEKAPAIFCTFMETFAGVLMHCSPAKKNRELNI